MRQLRQKNIVYFQVILLFLSIILIGFPVKSNAATSKQSTYDEFQVSSGVYYKDIRLKETNKYGTKHNATRVLEMNLNDPYTQVKIGYPDSLNKLQATTTQALRYHKPGHSVVGAINGSFNHLSTRVPMYLIAENNRLLRTGELSTSKSSYVSEPIAFGIDKNGKGLIDYYDIDLNFIHNGVKHNITSSNKGRTKDSIIMYNKDFHSNYTETNEYGYEVVVTLEQTPSWEFGTTYTGTVTHIREYLEKAKTPIPENGFVLSGNGKGMEKLKGIELGDSITISLDIDDKWTNASFMLGSGPMLVQNGKVSLTMDPNSSRAREVAPRSAVAIDKTGTKVFFVTVDGRQGEYSKGMNLTEFAEYLVSIGAYQALNLDGGGSTTLATRFPGDTKVSLANSPSDGWERGVSTILMAVSTEPEEHSIYYKDIKPGDTHYEGVRWISTKGINGYPDGTFGVSKPLTRPHAAIMFTNTLGLSVPSVAKDQKIFNDVLGDYIYANYIAAVKNYKIFNGSNGNFLPNKPLTREQMASTLVNAFGLKSNGKKVNINLSNVSDSHKNSVQILADLGITNQFEDFRPKAPVTRGQFATFLYKVHQLEK